MQKFHFVLISVLSLVCSVSHSEIRTTFATQGLSFISSDYESTENKNFFFVGATLRSDGKSQDAFKVNLTGMYAMGNSVLSYLNIREIYSTVRIDDKSVLHVGRKLKNWSAVDTIWNMGVYQPQFKWNPLAAENQGLSGLFWNKQSSGFGITLFASPLYIPDQSANYELKDGQFQSSNPWFAAPPQNIKFGSQILPIDYNINKPEVSSIIFQTQYGAHVSYSNASGYFANLAGIYKPSNQLALGYKGVLVTTRVRVDVTPKLYFENVYSADLGIKKDWGFFQISALYSKPQNPDFESTFNAPQFEPSMSFGPMFLYKFKPFELFLAHLETNGGTVKDVGPDASAERASLSERFLYKQATQVQLRYSDIFLDTFRWDSTLNFTSSSKEGFRQIKYKNYFKLRSSWSFWLDLLLIDTNSSIQTNIEPYKSSDQVVLGAGYDI